MVAHNPLHGSGRAGLLHPALASGDNAKAVQGIRMIDARRRTPAVNKPPHAVPQHTDVLAAARQGAVPGPADPGSKQEERLAIHGHP
jgi:hypothetical protein